MKPKHMRGPRPGSTYRGARRNAVRTRGMNLMQRRSVVEIDGSFRGSIELNRSQNWSRAKDYAYAREISPSKEPVR